MLNTTATVTGGTIELCGYSLFTYMRFNGVSFDSKRVKDGEVRFLNCDLSDCTFDRDISDISRWFDKCVVNGEDIGLWAFRHKDGVIVNP